MGINQMLALHASQAIMFQLNKQFAASLVTLG